MIRKAIIINIFFLLISGGIALAHLGVNPFAYPLRRTLTFDNATMSDKIGLFPVQLNAQSLVTQNQVDAQGNNVLFTDVNNFEVGGMVADMSSTTARWWVDANLPASSTQIYYSYLKGTPHPYGFPLSWQNNQTEIIVAHHADLNIDDGLNISADIEVNSCGTIANKLNGGTDFDTYDDGYGLFVTGLFDTVSNVQSGSNLNTAQFQYYTVTPNTDLYLCGVTAPHNIQSPFLPVRITRIRIFENSDKIADFDGETLLAFRPIQKTTGHEFIALPSPVFLQESVTYIIGYSYNVTTRRTSNTTATYNGLVADFGVVNGNSFITLDGNQFRGMGLVSSNNSRFGILYSLPEQEEFTLYGIVENEHVSAEVTLDETHTIRLSQIDPNITLFLDDVIVDSISPGDITITSNTNNMIIGKGLEGKLFDIFLFPQGGLFRMFLTPRGNTMALTQAGNSGNGFEWRYLLADFSENGNAPGIGVIISDTTGLNITAANVGENPLFGIIVSDTPAWLTRFANNLNAPDNNSRILLVGIFIVAGIIVGGLIRIPAPILMLISGIFMFGAAIVGFMPAFIILVGLAVVTIGVILLILIRSGDE